MLEVNFYVTGVGSFGSQGFYAYRGVCPDANAVRELAEKLASAQAEIDGMAVTDWDYWHCGARVRGETTVVSRAE